MVQAWFSLLRLVIQMRALFEGHLLGWLIEEISVPNWAVVEVEVEVEVISEQSLAKPWAMPKAKKSLEFVAATIVKVASESGPTVQSQRQ